MPSPNRNKQFVAGDYYHIYNRGVERRHVFMDARDYREFLAYLKLYLMPPQLLARPHQDLSTEVELAAYCLMPNHFHLLVKQHSERGISQLMRCVMIGYVRYFNKRHNRVGSLFQDIYKAVRIQNDQQLAQVEEYIYQNPAPIFDPVEKYPYSSLRYRHRAPAWMQPLPRGLSIRG